MTVSRAGQGFGWHRKTIGDCRDNGVLVIWQQGKQESRRFQADREGDFKQGNQ